MDPMAWVLYGLAVYTGDSDHAERSCVLPGSGHAENLEEYAVSIPKYIRKIVNCRYKEKNTGSYFDALSEEGKETI